jgi:uncharacterized RDD family membrane protein YckC
MSDSTKIDTNPYQAPTVHVDDIVEDGSGKPATRGSRLGAYVLDAAIVVFPALLIVGVIGYLFKADEQRSVLFSGIGVGVSMLMFLILNIPLLYKYGQTIGKRIMGIHISRTDGSRAGLARILFLRYFLMGLVNAIPFLGVATSLLDPLLIFQKSRRCLHDLIADTVVVRS